MTPEPRIIEEDNLILNDEFDEDILLDEDFEYDEDDGDVFAARALFFLDNEDEDEDGEDHDED